MTLQDLKNNRDAIIARYTELGGVAPLLKEFMTVMVEAVDFGLNESEDTLDLVAQFCRGRFVGEKQKSGGLREIMGAIAERERDNKKEWNPITSRWVNAF